jgi:transcriptional regulator with XRE-family HTH domain
MKHPVLTYRTSHGVSQEALARLVGTTGATISRIESGVRSPSPTLSRSISRHTAIPLYQLRPDLWDAPQAAVTA